jgi:putative RecB family exonuclease
MALPLPTSLTPSKVAAFKDCALAFRFSVIDGLPEPPSPPAVRGTLVHRALQLLLEQPADRRTPATAEKCLAQARVDLASDPEFEGLGLDAEAEEAFAAEAAMLVRRYFQLEDPRLIEPVGLELKLEVEVGSLTLRGIIDRLERDEHGGLVVTDYKTGGVPPVFAEQQRLGGVHFYAYLCEQVYGERPSRIQLLYLSEPVAIMAYPSEQSIRGLQQRTTAIWRAVERACEREDFRPRTSRLCEWCAFQAYCPAFGGDPARAQDLLATRAG